MKAVGEGGSDGGGAVWGTSIAGGRPRHWGGLRPSLIQVRGPAVGDRGKCGSHLTGSNHVPHLTPPTRPKTPIRYLPGSRFFVLLFPFCDARRDLKELYFFTLLLSIVCLERVSCGPVYRLF